ncbi:GNAT family N-acetyltransferase [Pseudoneobacillus sp. C159]
MKWIKTEMTESLAKEALQWKYEPPYDFYSNELSEEALKELLNGAYVAVEDENKQVVGYYCTGVSAQVPKGNDYGAYSEEKIDIGLGLKPVLTGQGQGKSFLRFIMDQIGSENLRLTVASFNKRAIKLYENVGFTYQQNFESNGVNFQVMVKK